MTSLQGVMGGHYALNRARRSRGTGHFRTLSAAYTGDQTPSSRAGLIDRPGRPPGYAGRPVCRRPGPHREQGPLRPTPRRPGIGAEPDRLGPGLRFAPRSGCRGAYLPVEATPEIQQAVLEFIHERLRNALLEQGARYDIVDAVLAAQGHNPARAAQAVKALEAWVSRPDWSSILPAYARCVRITRDLKERYTVETSGVCRSSRKRTLRRAAASGSCPARPGLDRRFSQRLSAHDPGGQPLLRCGAGDG